MTIQQLRYVLTISNYGSFNEASKKLYIAQSSLSASIKELENELNITIFNRSRRGIELTKEGTEFLIYAKQIVSQSDSVLARYSKNKTVTFFSVSSQHYDFVAEAFVHMIREEGESTFNFSIKETQTYELINDVSTGVSEIGIILVNNSELKIIDKIFHDNNIVFNSIFETKPYVFVNKKHPLNSLNEIELTDILNYPYITYTQGDKNSSQYSEELFEYFYPPKNIIINDRATLMNLLLETDSCTIGTGIMVSKLNSGKITSLPIKSNQTYSVGYITKKNTKLSKYGKKFIDTLKEIINDKM